MSKSLGFFDFWSTDDSAPSVDYMDPAEVLSPSFSVKELMTTNTGLFNQPPRSMENRLKSLAGLLEDLKTQIGDFHIASAYRSPEVNQAVGGSSTSRHMMGDAVDISPKGMSAEKYWGAIMLRDDLRERMGHIAWKATSMNAIHLTLPFARSSGEWIQNVPQVTQKIAGSVKYIGATPEQIENAKSKFLGITPTTVTYSSYAPTTGSYTGLIIAGLGVGVLAYALIRRNKG